MNRRFMVRLAALAMAGSLALAGCGDDDGAGSPDTAAATSTSAGDAAGTFNEADVTFAQGMIPHHEQAVEMSEIALDPARQASPEVSDLATRIQGAQDPEIQQMQGLLASWGRAEVQDMGTDHSGHGMAGMMTAEQMGNLEATAGTEFDTMWLEMMIQHHQGAVQMARTVQSAGVAPEVRELANEIITAQEAEIAEMNGLLGA